MIRIDLLSAICIENVDWIPNMFEFLLSQIDFQIAFRRHWLDESSAYSCVLNWYNTKGFKWKIFLGRCVEVYWHLVWSFFQIYVEENRRHRIITLNYQCKAYLLLNPGSPPFWRSPGMNIIMTALNLPSTLF